MRLTAIASAVALLSVAAFSYPAQAYCRGCASPRAAATTAAAAVAGATYGATMMPGANAQAYEPPPVPDSSATYRPATADDNAGCANGASRTFQRSWTADSDAPATQAASCD
jgi:hypothetical protein